MLNNNNYYNFKKLPLIPIYLQKYIIKLICIHINKVNRNNNLFFKRFENDHLLKSISFVCKTWFKVISNNLSVSVIYNKHKNNVSDKEYSILKRENIRILNFIYHYRNNNLDNIIQLNQHILQLNNLQKIIIDRCDLLVIRDIKFNNIKINDFYLSNNSIHPSDIPKNITQINNLSIAPCCQSNLIRELFQTTLKIKRIIEIDYYSPCQIPFKQFFTLNYLKQVVIYDLVILTVQELYYLLKGSPNVKRLSFYICFDNLIHFFTNKSSFYCKCNDFHKSFLTQDHECFYDGANENNNNNNNNNNVNNSSNSSSSIINYNNSNNNQNNQFNELNYLEIEIDDLREFKIYWDYISNCISNHSSLQFLKIINKCLRNNDSCGYYQKEDLFPNEFIESLGKPITTNSSLKSIVLIGFYTSQIFKYILNNGNKTIQHYHSEFLDNTIAKKQEYKEDIEYLLSQYKHIKYFTLKDKDSYVLNYINN